MKAVFNPYVISTEPLEMLWATLPEKSVIHYTEGQTRQLQAQQLTTSEYYDKIH